MGIIGKDFKYKKIENFLSKEEIELLNLYCEMKHRVNLKDFNKNQISESIPNSSFYGDPLMESLMLSKKSLVEKETGKKLLATYSYWRMYTKYSNLKKHKDRPACEVSVTACIKKYDNWPIIVEGTSFELEEGDAVLYAGCDQEHWRPGIYKGEGMAQVFLHYVNKNGLYKNHAYDKGR